MTKSELRLRLAGQLRAWMLGGDERHAAAEAICATVAQQRAWREARLVCAFRPLASEPGIARLWEMPGGPGFCFPRVSAVGVELIRVDDRESLRRADWRFAGAEFADAPVVAPEAVDVFLVPGLAFTRDGRRLGRGGGYYDRLLPRRAVGSTALGVCFAVQLAEELPVESHDQPVDAVITEHGLAE